jgi:hypothetical protein
MTMCSSFVRLRERYPSNDIGRVSIIGQIEGRSVGPFTVRMVRREDRCGTLHDRIEIESQGCILHYRGDFCLLHPVSFNRRVGDSFSSPCLDPFLNGFHPFTKTRAKRIACTFFLYA